MILQPRKIEILPPGALRRRGAEIRIAHQQREQLRRRLAGSRPAAVGVVVHPAVAPDPLIEERVAGAGVEPDDRRARAGRQVGDVGDAADVDDGAAGPGGVKQPVVKGRHQGRALAAGGEVARAEIGHGRDAGALGDDRRVAHLERERLFGLRVMAQGLAVAADGADGGFVRAGLLQHRACGAGEKLAESRVQRAYALDRAVSRLAEKMDFIADGGGDGRPVRGHQREPAVGGDGGEHGVNAVHAGSRHEADVKHDNSFK